MSAHDPDARIRNALTHYLIAKLQPLYPGADLRPVFAGWVAGLSTDTLAACLRQDRAATADALSAALVVDDGTPDVVAQLAELADLEYPRLPEDRRRRLAQFAATVRRIATDGDGTATGGALMSEGCQQPEIELLMPKASHLLMLLGGAARYLHRLPQDQTTAHARLARAGDRAAARRAA